MVFLELDLAVFRRLVGAPLDSKGLPLIDPKTREPYNRHRVGPPDHGGGEVPSYGIRIPTMTHPHDAAHNLTSKSPNSTPLFKGFNKNSFRQVPVFSENIEGRKWADVWPCVTFRCNSVVADPQPGAYQYFDTVITPDPEASKIEILDRVGVVDRGPTARMERPHPEPYLIQYAITARAKNPIEVDLICQQIMYLLPQKSALVVGYANGETHPCDMSLDGVVVLDAGGDDIPMAETPQEQRNYGRMFLYKVEAWVDNTTNYYGLLDNRRVDELVYSRLLTLQDTQERVSRTTELSGRDNVVDTV